MIRFTKMEGIGNDYVYINGFEEHIENPAALAVKMSRYHYGCGADGLIMILPSDKADFRMQMFNNDGSESEMCGNGIRCVAAYCHDRGLTDKTEFTIESGGQIKVSLVRQGRDAIFTVSDNGPGIPKENLPHVFDRFYRVDKARSREKGGTGLGLSIVHQLVLLHGGAIRVESEEGTGASFIVELPLHQG